ncbi:MAG TPA: AMP-binding protein, partial [Pseudonocardia sp.]
MTERSSLPSTVLELFDRACDKITLSWAAGDLTPAPDWVPAPDSSGWCVLDGQAVGRHVRSLAAGLVSLGVRPGERVALMMANRPEHWLTDQAVLKTGAIPCTFYPTLSAEQVRAQAEHARISTVVLEGATQLEQWSLAISLPQLRRIIVLDGQARRATAAVAGHTYAETLARGADLLARDADALIDAASAVGPDDPTTIIFTSGTTAAPKAVLITHRNVLAVLSGIDAVGTMPATYRTVSYLPTAHIVDRMGSIYLALVSGGEIAFSPTPRDFDRVIARSRPTSLIGVPRIWERVLAGLDDMAETTTSAQRLLAAGLDRLELAITAGAPMPLATSSKLRNHGLPLV